MNIKITQVDNDFASRYLNIYLDGNYAGYLDRGSSLMLKAENDIPHRIRAEVGFYDGELAVNDDTDILVSWRLSPPYLVLSEQK